MSRIKGILKGPFPLTILLVWVGWSLLSFFHFANPVPSKDFRAIIFLQFMFAFIPNLYGRKYGRIFTVTGALIFVRMHNFAGINWELTTLAGLFLGAMSGIIFRELLLDLLGRRDKIISPRETDPVLRMMGMNRPVTVVNLYKFLPALGIVLFLLVVIYERYLTYYNAPIFKIFPESEYLFFPGISSRMALSLPLQVGGSILFPLLYFIIEELTSPEGNQPQKHWAQGLLIGFTIQVLIFSAQWLYGIKIFSQNTNLSLESNRLMGLFRDSGSSSWIFPVLILFILIQIHNKKGEWRNWVRWVLYAVFILGGLLIGIRQGRVFWITFIPILSGLTIYKFWHTGISKGKKIIITSAILFLFCLTLFLIFRFGRNFGTDHGIAKFSTTINQAVHEGFHPKRSLVAIDANRYYNNLFMGQRILENPIFGNGLGHLITDLKGSPQGKSSGIILPDGPASFYLGALYEVGIAGALCILFFFLYEIWARGWKTFSFLLVIPFFTGYQLLHPDGGFVGIYIAFFLFPRIRHAKIPSLVSFLTILGLTIALLLSSFFKINREGTGPMFRKEDIGKFQNPAWEVKENHFVYINIPVWKLGSGKRVSLDIFLDKTTSMTSMKYKVAFYNTEWKIIQSTEGLAERIRQNKEYNIPQGAEFLSLEEITGRGYWHKPSTPFCLPKANFDSMNRLITR